MLCYKGVRLPSLHDFSFVYDHNFIKEVQDHIQAMRDHDNCVIAKLLLDNSLHYSVIFAIHVGTHLVQQQYAAAAGPKALVLCPPSQDSTTETEKLLLSSTEIVIPHPGVDISFHLRQDTAQQNSVKNIFALKISCGVKRIEIVLDTAASREKYCFLWNGNDVATEYVSVYTVKRDAVNLDVP